MTRRRCTRFTSGCQCDNCSIWLSGYEAARKQASFLAEDQCSCDEGCLHDDCCQPGRIVQAILAMQPEKP